MGLPHPGQLCPFLELHSISPEFLKGLPLQLVQEGGTEAASFINNPINLPLVMGLQEMGDKVVVIGTANYGGQYPAFHSRILCLLQQIIDQQQLIHGRRGLYKVHGRPGIKDILLLVGQIEVPGVAQFVGQGKEVSHLPGPGHQDIGVAAIGA